MIREKIANPSTDRATAEQIGKEIVNAGLGGLGLGAGATGLYYLLHGLRQAESPFGDSRISGVVPGVKLKKKKPKPSRDPGSPINTYKTAADWQTSANKLLADLYYSVGSKVPKSIFGLFSGGGGTPSTPNATGTQEAFKLLGQLGAAGLGGYTGMAAINNIANSNRVTDVKDDVEAARQEYFDALTGKSAEVLDATFDALQEKAGKDDWVSELMRWLDRTTGQYVTTPALGVAAGTGLLGGMYMYDQTKSRNKSENLRRAAAARARLAGLQKTPYIDPEELAALTQKG